MTAKARTLLNFVLTVLLLAPFVLGVSPTSHAEALRSYCNGDIADVGQESLVYATNTKETLTLTLKILENDINMSANFKIAMKHTRFLAYVPGYLLGIYSKDGIYSYFVLKLATGTDGSASFIGKPEVEVFPKVYGNYVTTLAPDYVGLRVFMVGGRHKPTRISNILYYDPESKLLYLVYSFQQPVFDMAYYPIKRRLYLLADHLLILDLDFVEGNLLAPSHQFPATTSCNPIFGRLTLGVEQLCERSYPLLHFVKKPYPSLTWYQWNIVDGESGVCFRSERNASLPQRGPIRRFLFYKNWVIVLYLNGSAFGVPRSSRGFHPHEGSSTKAIANGVTAMTSVIPNLFKDIAQRCLSPASKIYPSLIITNTTIINSTSARVATFYNPEMFTGICSNLSFPSLKLTTLIPPRPPCEGEGDECLEVPKIDQTLIAPGILVFSNLLPGVSYNVTISAKSFYIKKSNLYTIDKKVTFDIPSDYGMADNSAEPQIIAVATIVPLMLIAVVGVAVFLMQRKRRRKHIRGLYASNELYLGLDLNLEYATSQIHLVDPDAPVGEGRFGQVFEALLYKNLKEKDDVTRVAVKIVEDVGPLVREAKLMAPLNHENVVGLVGICLDKLTEPRLLLEWMDCGDLLHKLKKLTMGSEAKKDALVQVCRGLKYLSDCGCVHRDIAARNVLVNSDDMYKLGDFGLSREFPADKDYYRMVTDGVFPVKWMAPECLSQSPVFSTKADVWAFGVLMYEVYTSGGTPYPTLSAEESIKFIRLGGCPCMPSGCGEELHTIMNQCWMPKPEDRASPTRLLKALECCDDNYVKPNSAGSGYTTISFGLPPMH